MSKFNQVVTNRDATVNKAGGASFKVRDPRFALYTMVAANLIEDQFYQSRNKNIEALRQQISEVPHDFVAKLAVYARENMNLRTVPLVLMVELARIHNGDNLVGRGTSRVIQRADELSEILAYYKMANGLPKVSKVSKQLAKGIADAFHKFDAYQFAKYQKKGADISLRDAMFITHPIPASEEQAKLFSAIASESLETAETWEAQKSALGQEISKVAPLLSQAKKEELFLEGSRQRYQNLIDDRKMGYMATLRNLIKFLECDLSTDHIQKVTNYLMNDTAVANSKQFPFRFYTAYRELLKYADKNTKGLDVAKARELIKGVKIAGIKSMRNLEAFDASDKILSVADVSGSMDMAISQLGSVTRREIAVFYSSMFSKMNDNCKAAYFGSNFKYETDLDLDPFQANEKSRCISGCGHSTDAHKVIEDIYNRKQFYDKIVIWSDIQFWVSSKWSFTGEVANKFNEAVKRYRKNINPNMKLYLVDLSAYGAGYPVRIQGNDAVINGFTDETFRILGNFENSGKIIEEIEAIEL